MPGVLGGLACAFCLFGKPGSADTTGSYLYFSTRVEAYTPHEGDLVL